MGPKTILAVPPHFTPPIVLKEKDGLKAFHAYDWYFSNMQKYLGPIRNIFLVPCAQTKPIHTSSLHRNIYRKFAKTLGQDREILVVSEPVVLIRYQDLYDCEPAFLYDYPPKLLNPETRQLFVTRLRILLEGKNIIGCLPRHHASLINNAIGANWQNYWKGDLFSMTKQASRLA